MWGLLMLLHSKSCFAFLHCLENIHRSICLLLHLCTMGKMMGSERMRNSSRPGMGGHTYHSDCGLTVSCKCPLKWYKTEDCCLGWDGTWWDNAAASYRSACIGRYVVQSCWSLSGIGYGSCNCLKASFFLLPRILFFMCISYCGGSLGSVRDLFCLLQQVTVLCLVFLIY